MAAIDFPFWIVTQRRGLISLLVEPADAAGFIAAFSTAGKAAKFMVDRGATEWDNKLVFRANLADLVADLRNLGARGLCLNPTKDGGGAKVAFDQLG